jgi:hypothetical protein
MQKRPCAVLLLALIGAAAQAQESVYVGIGYGGFDYEESRTDPVLGKVGDTLDSYKLFGGFEFNDNFAIEVSYGETDDLMQAGSVIATVADENGLYPNTLVSSNANLDFASTTLRALGQVPLGWGVFIGGIGYHRTDGDVRETISFDNSLFPSTPVVFRDDFTISNNGLMATLALEWRFGRFGTRYGVRVEYEWWDIDEVDASTLGLALSYGF